jgi:hypothetical protein
MKDKAGRLARHVVKRIAIRRDDGEWHEVSHTETELDAAAGGITTVWFIDGTDDADVKTFNPCEDVEFLIL